MFYKVSHFSFITSTGLSLFRIVKDPECQMWSLIQNEFDRVEKEDHELVGALSFVLGFRGDSRGFYGFRGFRDLRFFSLLLFRISKFSVFR